MAKKTHQKHSKVAKTASPAAGSIQKPSPAAGTERLGRWNLWIAAFCLLQALLVLLLAKDHVFPVQVSYPTPNPIESAIAGHQVITMASRHLFDVHLVYPVAYFLLVVAVVRGMCSTIFRFQ